MLFEANFLGERANARPLHCFTCPYSNDQLSGAQLRYALVFHSSTKNRRWRAQTRYLGQLNGSFEPKPTAIVDSGNGIQCLWRLNQPIDLAQFPLAQDKHRKLILGPEALQIVDDAEARRPSLKERKLSRTLKPSRVAANCASVNWPTSWTRDTATERWQKLLVDFANDTKLQPSLRISAAQAAAPYQFPRKMSVAPPQYIHTQIVIPDFDSIEAAESFLAELTARVGAAEIDFQSAEVVSSRVQGWINSKRQGEELELKKLNAGQETGEHFIKIQGGMPIMPGCEQLIMPHQVVSNGRVLEGNTAQGLLNPQPGPKTIEHVEASSPQIKSTPENPAHDTET